jgi:excinuclease ABC subunit A
MHFLADVYVTCDLCNGKRYNPETLSVTYRGMTIFDALQLSVDAASIQFESVPRLQQLLSALRQVGLGYMRLGQAATTLSGGEAQRLKLATELSKTATGNTLYILDEPTTGLHFSDIEALLGSLFALRDAGNTVVLIEHDIDVIECADWIVDLGPEGGSGGGEIVAVGTPETLSAHPLSHTGHFIALQKRAADAAANS